MAYRRHQAEVAKAATRRWLDHRAGRATGTAREIGRRATTPRPCSCYLCGHRRDHHGMNRQERRARALGIEDI